MRNKVSRHGVGQYKCTTAASCNAIGLNFVKRYGASIGSHNLRHRHQVGIFSFSHTSCIFLGRVPCYVFYTTVDPMIDLHLYHLASASPNSSCRFLNVSLDKGGIFLDPHVFWKILLSTNMKHMCIHMCIAWTETEVRSNIILRTKARTLHT